MRSLTEVAADLNAIKTERSHTRIVVPNEVQEDENYKLIAELLAGTGIEQAELAGLSMEVGASTLRAIETISGEGGGIDGMEMMGLVASLWIDGLILGARYMAQDRDDELTVHDLALMPRAEQERIFLKLARERDAAIRPAHLSEAIDATDGQDAGETP